MLDMSSESAPAWAQAILSALAIWYSGRLAFNQANAAKREKVNTYASIMASALDDGKAAVQLSRMALIHRERVSASAFGFSGMKHRLDEIPFHDVPDHRLIELIRNASMACEMLHEHFDSRLSSLLTAQEADVVAIEEAASTLAMCVIDAEGISDELMPFRQRLFRRVLDFLRPHN